MTDPIAIPKGNSDDRTPNELREPLNALWRNWAFRLSLSSNELFHSNVLQYLAEGIASISTLSGGENDEETWGAANADEGVGDAGPESAANDMEPEAIGVNAVRQLLTLLCRGKCNIATEAFRKLDAFTGRALKVEREKHHMDLVVSIPETDGNNWRALFALEIKVKAYPTFEQLDEYRDVLNKQWLPKAKNKQKSGVRDLTTTTSYKPPLFLLTGMGEEIPLPDSVHRLSFGDVAVRLHSLTEGDRVVRNEYARLCLNLHALFGSLKRCLDPTLTWQEAEKKGKWLEDYRVHAIWWKLWGWHLADLCKRKVKSSIRDLPDWSHLLHVDAGFTRTGNANVCWRWADESKGRSLREAISIGVQIEGASVRLFLNVVHESLGTKSQARSNVEAILLKLIGTHGVFASNPEMQTLVTRWKATRSGSYDNAAAWIETKFSCSSLDSSTLVQPGVGKARDKAAMLTGYANGAGNGFADIRFRLVDSSELAEVTDFVSGVLVDQRFSRGERVSGHAPLLLRVVLGFAEATCKKDWLKRPSLAACAPTPAV